MKLSYFMIQHRLHLHATDSRKPLQKLINRGAVSPVIKKCGYRHPGPPKYPRSAHFVGVALNSRKVFLFFRKIKILTV